FRIVDFYGEFFTESRLEAIFNSYIRKNSLDYIDFFNYGLDVGVLSEKGFRKVVSCEKYPHYTEPEDGASADLKGAVKCHPKLVSKLVINKSDSDQDRPNIIRW
ncbi:hypothetical protein OAG38_07530, partial [Akkermansiaceae bacterium]|nr:hypothetical protein [Akkermansiaceae bacterium]